jgi:hypothetical protein
MLSPSSAMSWGYHTIFPPCKDTGQSRLSPPYPSNADDNDIDNDAADVNQPVTMKCDIVDCAYLKFRRAKYSPIVKHGLTNSHLMVLRDSHNVRWQYGASRSLAPCSTGDDVIGVICVPGITVPLDGPSLVAELRLTAALPTGD